MVDDLAGSALTGGTIGVWQINPPPGLTDTGRIRRFQDRTVARLKDRALEIARPAFEELVRTVESTYTEGTGNLAENLMYDVQATRDGISVAFGVAGDVPEVVFLTALAGLPVASPGHWIAPRNAPKMVFFWKNPPGGSGPGVYAFRTPVFWRPRAEAGDVIAEVLGSHAVRFEQEMVRAHEEAVLEFQQENAEQSTRSTRVATINVNDIRQFDRP
jgi:hypothetical protein